MTFISLFSGFGFSLETSSPLPCTEFAPLGPSNKHFSVSVSFNLCQQPYRNVMLQEHEDICFLGGNIRQPMD